MMWLTVLLLIKPCRKDEDLGMSTQKNKGEIINFASIVMLERN